jgi:hypothetical protein
MGCWCGLGRLWLREFRLALQQGMLLSRQGRGRNEPHQQQGQEKQEREKTPEKIGPHDASPYFTSGLKPTGFA